MTRSDRIYCYFFFRCSYTSVSCVRHHCQTQRLSSVVMSGCVDAIMRPLKIPPKFVPYMEKHRIYELLYEIATELAIVQPPDHLLYLKQCLKHAAGKRDSSRIILIGPTDFQTTFIARYLQKKMGLTPISLKEICNVSPDVPMERIDEERVVKNLKEILKNLADDSAGWVLVDVPRKKSEARAIQLAGVIPTCVLEVAPSVRCRCSSEKNLQRKNLKDLRKIYENLLIKVDADGKKPEELAEICAMLSMRKKHCGAPSVFRIALIGSRGSGCRSIAKHLSRRFDLVHVDFYDILQQAEQQETPLGEELRAIECRCDGSPNAETSLRVVQKYILAEECTRKGWVLTGYPITVEDFQLLDTTATPPNRVIFVKTDVEVRKERLLNRRFNVLTGSKHIINSKNKTDVSNKLLAVHPNDCECIVEQNIREYDENVEFLMRYAGTSASIIDGNGAEKIVGERVEACLMQPAPCASPRMSVPPKKIDPMTVEFDPDDEPDPRIFDDIRNPESSLSFI